MSVQKPLSPRNGHILRVCVVARISGCVNQKELSLEDQVDHAKEVVSEKYTGAVEYKIIATKGKGERSDRPELDEIEKLIRSRTLDLLVCEDLGRVVRGAEAIILCGLAVDCGVRVLALNDYIDTVDDGWLDDVYGASQQHVGHNSHTSKRIKQKLMNRFKKLGAATPLPIFGLNKPSDAKTFDDWTIDPSATPILNEWYRRLLEKPNASAIADWLNETGVRPGPHARGGKWDGPMVLRITRNPILKGVAARGFRHTVKRHETGRRLSELNPEGPQYRECPHLKQVEPDLWDAVNAKLDATNKQKGGGPKGKGREHDRWNVPRARSLFPGQHAHCAYCGRKLYWGANGQAENLICSGGKDWKCWNSIGIDGKKVVDQVSALVIAEIAALDGFETQFRAIVEDARRSAKDPRIENLERDQVELNRRKNNLLAALAECGPNPMLKEKLAELDAEAKELAGRFSQRDRLRPVHLPDSPTELRRLLEEKFKALASGSWQFGDLLREIVPVVDIYLVRLLDGGHLFPRARVTVNLAGILPDADRAPQLKQLLTREVTLDVFDPPQREQIRKEAMRLKAKGFKQREIASRLGVTQPAVTNALMLDRRMKEAGKDTPYEVVTAPPEDYSKLRRHLHPRYQFTPVEGHIVRPFAEDAQAA